MTVLRLPHLTRWENVIDGHSYPGDDDDGGAAGLKPAADCFSCAFLGAADSCRLIAHVANGTMQLRILDRRVPIADALTILVEYRAVDSPNDMCPGHVLAVEEELLRRCPDLDLRPTPPTTTTPPAKAKAKAKRELR